MQRFLRVIAPAIPCWSRHALLQELVRRYTCFEVEPEKWSFPMHKWIAGLVALTVMSVVTLPAAGQTTCPEGQHYDTEKKMCVPHGK